jgi:hypothetical protein
LCILGILLLAWAVILDDMAVLFAGSTLVAVIVWQYLLFDHQLREIVASIEVRRTLSRNPVRKGTSLQVSSGITFRGSPRMQVEMADLIPATTTLDDGTTTIAARPGPKPRTIECTYRIIPLIHGTHNFSGISINVRNHFFEETILMTRPMDCEPTLTVLPTGLFAAPVSELADGTRDNRKASIWSGLDIHSLREFQSGDDLRHADWKISAKYDKIFIRKYTAPMSYPPLVIVDLPFVGAPFREKEFGRMISEVTGLIQQNIQTFQYVSVLIISGPNILHLIREERNGARCMAEIREWMHPAERTVHFYHMPDRSDIRSYTRNCESALEQATDPGVLAFYESLRNRYLAVLQYQRNPAFSGQVARTLSQILTTEAYFFSLGYGDISHIRHVIRPLKAQKIKVHLRIISTAPMADIDLLENLKKTVGVRP